MCARPLPSVRHNFCFVLWATCFISAQGQVIDGAYPKMRIAINAQVDVLGEVPDEVFAMNNSEPMGDYALEEPWSWAKRVYFRIDPTENKELDAITDERGALSLADVVNAALDADEVTQFDDLTFRAPVMAAEHRIMGVKLFLAAASHTRASVGSRR